MEGEHLLLLQENMINVLQYSYPLTPNGVVQADYKTTKITPELKGKIARAKLRGAKPKVPFEIRNTTDASILAVLNAMDWCYRNDPNLRPSASAIASGLRTALLEAEQGITNATMAGSE